MAYQILPHKCPARGLQRIATEQVTYALDAAKNQQADTATHQIRKNCKKIRALLRLIQKSDDHTRHWYPLENAHYRQIAHTLSGSRDAIALRDALRNLPDANQYPETLAYLEARARQQADPQALDSAMALLQQGANRIANWPLRAVDGTAITAGYRRSYRRARKAMSQASGTSSAELFHGYRKRVKDQWYHTRLLQKKFPQALNTRRAPLKGLAQALGDWRDLTLLRRSLARQGTHFGGELIPLLDAIEKQRSALYRQIEQLGQELFAAKNIKLGH